MANFQAEWAIHFNPEPAARVRCAFGHASAFALHANDCAGNGSSLGIGDPANQKGRRSKEQD